MNVHVLILTVALAALLACNKSPNSSSPVPASSRPPDAVEQKLQSYAGNSATDCGRLNVQSPADQAKAASDCAMNASQAKKPFYVAYDMPGMAVGVAGNADGRLFTVQSQGSGDSANVTAGDCPSQLRVASSGRVTCFAPGDMGSMSGSHMGGGIAPGMPNPHGSGMENPHGAGGKTK
ncbi:MAG TPA: hypothetical protein VJQ59_17210 [Candidatus Sulfotelmatobacter sp.]|nr:hypothetical protein [Candidatus Sulfotelmatobacter sp.]